MTNAGRVLLIPRGDYNAATTYTMLDVVYYQGRSYVCKQTSTGNLPTNTTYWQAMTEADADKMNVTNPTGTGSFSLNRKANTTVGNHSFAEGINCTASGNTSHAEGEETTASGGQGAHAEGTSSTASGNMSHAEGNTTTASGTAAHSEGMVTQAIGKYTHAGGYYNQANYDYQTVIGKNNSNKTTTLFEVGNGSSYASADRSNAFEVYSDGSLSTDNGTTKVKLEDLVSQNQALTNYSKNYQEVYGSKNIWNFNPNSDIRERGNCSIAINDNTYSFTATTGYDGTSYTYPKLLTVGRKYHMQFKSKFTKADSIDGRIIVTPLDSWDISGSYFNYQCTSSDADFVTKDYEFTATAEKLVFNVYVQFGTGSGNKFELKDLMIYDVDACLDNSYTPYAKTNVELTDAIGKFKFALIEGDAPSSTDSYENYTLYNVSGIICKWFTILSAEKHNMGNNLWYEIAADTGATEYVAKASVDDGDNFRVKFSDIASYNKFRAIVMYY